MQCPLDPLDPCIPDDFLALECNPCFSMNVCDRGDSNSTQDNGVPNSPEEVRRHPLEVVRNARRQSANALTDAVKFGRLLYRVRTNGTTGTDLASLWTEVRGYIERQDGVRSTPLLDHIGKVVGLCAMADNSGCEIPSPIIAIDLMHFEHVMRSVIAMVEVVAGAMEEDWVKRTVHGI